MSLIFSALIDFPMVETGDSLLQYILQTLSKTNITLQNGDILVLAQKIVSKAEGRWVYLPDIKPSQEALALAAETEKDPGLVELILKESKAVLRKRPGLIITEHKLGFISANAGIDHSNVKGSEDWVLLLPENPDRSANLLRQQLQQASGAQIGVLIIDSHGRPWRNGTVGVSIGLAGLPALIDKRGEHDMFGYELKATVIGVADELAAGASLLMGQCAEGTPVVHVRGFPYKLADSSLKDLLRDQEQDLFR